MLHHGNKKMSPISPLCRAVRLLGRERKRERRLTYTRDRREEIW
jgi:hypothetical protein